MDALSRPPGANVPEDSRETALLPSKLFLNVFGADSDRLLEHQIMLSQRRVSNIMNEWMKDLPIIRDKQEDGPVWRHEPLGCLVVPPMDEIRKEVV